MFKSSYLRAQEQIQFLADFSLWLQDGQAADHALAGMQFLAEERKRKQELRVIASLRQALAQGKPIAYGMKAYFSHELTMLVEIGQEAGCLADLLERYQRFTQRRRSLIQTCIRGLVYPLLLFISALTAVVFVGWQIIPRLQQFDGASEPPLLVASLSFIAEFLIAILPTLLVVMGLVAILVYYALPHWSSPYRRRFEWLLPFSVFKTYSGIYLLQAMSLLLSSKIGLARALHMFESRSSAYLAEHLSLMRVSLAAGELSLHKVFNTGLFSLTTLYRMQTLMATQQSKARLFAQLADRLVQDGERTLRLHQRGFIVLLYVVSVLCILWILISMGLLFTELAHSWS
ncbi:MAG: type II secretion system F family protein [Idiomarina sp.]|nr:type II secretion system F family protein [Idiomarina sp.]